MTIFAAKEKWPAPATVGRRSYVHTPLGPVQRAQQARIGRILRSTGAQARLTIGQPNDRYEQEADRVVDKVMAMPDPGLQKQPENEEEEIQTNPLADQITPLVQRKEEPPEEEEEPLQAKFWYGETVQRMCPKCEEEQLQTKEQTGRTQGVTPNIESRINSLKGGGQLLDSATRSFFEPRFGRDFSDVRLHTDWAAADTARSINARAFTVGNHVAMGSGEYHPDLQSGKRLLGHELTHVIQQVEGRTSNVNPTSRINEVNPVVSTTMVALQSYPNNECSDVSNRTSEEVDNLVRDTLLAIAQNEIGGAAVAPTSRLKTSAGIPASYASATQMVPVHVVTTLRAGRFTGQARGQLHQYATVHGLSQRTLRTADRIMHAAQRIWNAVVLEGRNISELSERDMELSGFTLDEYVRMFRFSEIRRLLLLGRFQEIESAVASTLEFRGAMVDSQLANLLTELSSSSEISEAENAIQEHLETGLGDIALATLSRRRLRPVSDILFFTLPRWWMRGNSRRRRRWLERRRRRITRVQRRFAKVAKQAAESLLAHEMSQNEHAIALGLREADLRAYIHMGRFNRFPEDRQAWNRIALRHHQLDQSITFDDAIRSAAESGGGWDLSRLEYEIWIRDWMARHPCATDEEVVRAAAAHNGRSRDYPDTIWGHFQRIRSAENEVSE